MSWSGISHHTFSLSAIFFFQAVQVIEEILHGPLMNSCFVIHCFQISVIVF